MQFHPANYSYYDKHWSALNKCLPPLPPEIAKELGYGGRDYQKRCIETFRSQKRTLLIAPTGSGKSLTLVFRAALEILDTKYKQKQVFVVPQLHLSQGFSEGQHSKLSIDGQTYEWEITENYCLENKKSVQKIKDFLIKPISCNSYKANNIIGGCTASVSYAALLRAFQQMTKKELKIAFKNTSFTIDEVHHIKGVDVDSNTYANQLGTLCKSILNHDGHLHLATATFFRGDNQLIIDKSYLKQFVTFRVEFLEHWKNLNLKALHQCYECYHDGDDLLNKIIESIKSEPDCPPIIIVPVDKTKIFKKTGKKQWVKDVVKELEDIYGEGQVLDLVSPERQAKDKQKLLSHEQEFKAIVTCMIGKEGTDWPPCSRIYNMVLDANVLAPIQKLGRGLRPHQSKIDVKMINYVEHFDSWDQDPKKIRELISDRFNAVLIASMLDEMLYPILMPTIPTSEGANNTSNSAKQVTLSDVYGDKRHEVIRHLIQDISALKPEEKNAEFIDSIIYDIIYAFEDEMLEEIDTEILFLRLRQEVLRMHSNNDQNLKIKGIDVQFVREQGWDKVVKKHISPNSPFVGSAKTNDLKQLSDFLSDNWSKQIDAVIEAGYETVRDSGSSHPLYYTARKIKRRYDELEEIEEKRRKSA